MLTVREIQGNIGLRISPEAAMEVQKYGSVFIQFPKFTYLRLATYDGCPLMLPRFVDDKLILIEICRQISQINKLCRNRRVDEMLFPIDIGYYSYDTASDARNIERSIATINLHPYTMRFPYDSKGYAVNAFKLNPSLGHFPALEDFWEDCENDFEVRKRDWMWLTVRQVVDFQVDIDVIGIDDDEGPLVDPFYYEKIEPLELPPIDWSIPELKSLRERTSFVLKRTRDWVNKVRAEGMAATFRGRERKTDQGESSQMALKENAGKKIQQLDTNVPNQSQSLNHLTGFTIKKTRTKTRSESTRTDQEED